MWETIITNQETAEKTHSYEETLALDTMHSNIESVLCWTAQKKKTINNEGLAFYLINVLGTESLICSYNSLLKNSFPSS